MYKMTKIEMLDQISYNEQSIFSFKQQIEKYELVTTIWAFRYVMNEADGQLLVDECLEIGIP